MFTQWMKRTVLLMGVLSGVLCGPDARAYNAASHQEIVNTAWDVMLASQDPALTTGRGLFTNLSTAPKSLRSADAPMSQAEWDAYFTDIRAAILALNRMPSGLSSSSNHDCSGIGPLVTLGKIARRISTSYSGKEGLFQGDNHDGESCSLASERSGIYASIGQGSALQFGNHSPPPGFVSGLAGEFGNTEGQGLALGWHSKAGDDCLDDVVLGINVGQILINLPIPALGGLSLKQVLDIGIAIVAAPFICLFDLFSGNDCGDAIEQARNFATDVNPLTALAGLVPPVGGVHWSIFTGIPHFINAVDPPGPPRNRYDDRRGILYDHAGPDGVPGAVDIGIMLLTEKAGAVIDVNNALLTDLTSLMVPRYDLGKGVANDGHPEVTTSRSHWTWNRETVGHTPMTPIDNFAFFGWSSFQQDPQRSVKNLRWPLHALGDATVPMHITGTTAWGHRAYEDAFNNSLGLMKSDTVLVDKVAQAQLEQVRRILKEGFAVRQFIKTERAALGRPNDTPTRDLVTKLALESLAKVDELGGDWYCDSCSTQYLFGGTTDSTAHYMDGDHVDRMQVMFEKSAAFTLAFLMSAAEQPIQQKVCGETGESCQNDAQCCVGACDGSAHQCLPPPPITGAFACDANGNCPRGKCVNGYCEGGTECNRGDQCPSGECQNGFCGGACATAADCSGGGCENGKCCSVDHRNCATNSQCCNGLCLAGECRPSNGAPGDACSIDSDCVRGSCQNGACSSACDTSIPCPSGEVCQNSVCCVALNSPCLLDGDCCGPFSRCGDIGSSTLQCLQPLLPGAGACSRDVECLRGRCEGGICQSNCDADVACANGTCVDGECCVDTGGLCAFDTDCCGVLTCQNNRCSSQVTR